MTENAKKIDAMHRNPGAIISKPASAEYRENFDRIFKKEERDDIENNDRT